MSKGLLNSMVLKNLFEDVDGKELLPVLIESGVISKEQVEEYYKTNIKSQKVQKPTYSIIKVGVLVKFDERDLNSRGEYTTPRGIVEIGDNAFERCYDLRKIHLGRDVVEIGSRAFDECRNLEQVTMTNSVRKMGQYAFASCLSLTAIKLSDNLKDIPAYAFAVCENLQTLILPSKLEQICDYAFGNCVNLNATSNPPESLGWVHADAFSGTPIKKDFMRLYHKQHEEQSQQKGNTK